MPFVVGIALTGLSAGSRISIEVLSTDDEKSSYSFQQEIIDSSNLTSTFEKIADSIPESFADIASPITLLCPSHLTEEAKEELVKLVNAVPKFSSMWARAIDNIHVTLAQALIKVPYPPQIELALEVGPDAATARLISTSVEAGIRETTIEKEIIIRDIQSADLIAQLVDPALVALKEIPTQDDPKRKFEVNANDRHLKRVLILDFSPTFVSSLVQELKCKFREILPPVECIVENNLARHAADSSLAQHRTSKDDLLYFNVCPLRVGVVKADGFVSTVMENNQSLPLRKTVMFTTSVDKQATATIKVVVGIPPKGEDNTVIAELVLEELTRRSRGATHIKVTFDVEQMGETQIVAEELMEDGALTGSTASIQLHDIVGDTLTSRDVKDIYARCGDFILANVSYHDAAVESEAQWAGKKVQGDLPE